MTNGQLKTKTKENIIDMKYNKKTSALTRMYKKELLQINFKNIPILWCESTKIWKGEMTVVFP